MDKIPGRRIALIGCGRWGRNIARALSRHGALALIVDPMADKLGGLAEELGASVTSDLDAAFAAEIDGVAIAAPATDHASLAERALRAGKPVYVEKPLAMQVSDAEKVAALAAEMGLPLMVGHLLQYHPAFVALLAAVKEGQIGEIRHVTSNRLNPGAIRTEENALWSMGPHDFSMILALFGSEPEHIAALPVLVVNHAIPDQFAVQMRFSGGRTAQATLSWLSPYKEHKLTVLGTAGALVFEDTASDPSRKLVIYRNYVDRSGLAPAFVKGPGEPLPFGSEEPLMNEMAGFLNAIAGMPGCVTGPEEAIPVLKLLHAAQKASEG